MSTTNLEDIYMYFALTLIRLSFLPAKKALHRRPYRKDINLTSVISEKAQEDLAIEDTWLYMF